MTKTKSQKQRAKAQRAAGGKPAGGARKPRGQRPRRQRQVQPFVGPRQRPGTAVAQMRKNRKTFSEMLVSDGLNKALQMHNSASIVDHFPRRMEKVCDIIPTSTSFAIFQALYLNPGNSVLFPIFSQIAGTYEQFRWRFLRFHYVSEAYTASGSNVSAGKVIMATNADPSDSQFANSTQMENYAGADRGAPFSNFCHDALAALKLNSTMPLKEYFVNPSANSIAPSNDSTSGKFYDSGLFQFATSGLPSASSVEYGELYVEFEVDMIRPKQQTPLGQNLISAHYVGVPTNTSAFAAPVQRAGSNMALTFANTSVAIPVIGRFLVAYFANCGTSFTSGGDPAVSTNCTAATILAGNALYRVGAGSGTAQYVWIGVVDVNAVGGLVSFAAPTIVGTSTWDLIVTQIPTSLTAVAKPETFSELTQRAVSHELQLMKLGQMLQRVQMRLAAEEEEDEEKGNFVTEESDSAVEVAASPLRTRKAQRSQTSSRVAAGSVIAPERMAQGSKAAPATGGWFSSS